MRSDFSIGVLAESEGLVTILEVFLNLTQEVVWSENACEFWMLSVGLVSWVHVVVLFGADWSPSIKTNQTIIEDFLGVNVDKATISVVSDTTTVVTLSDQVLNSLPWDSTLDVGGVWCFLNLTHVVGN